MNLALFVDKGKIEDLIPFTDIGLSFAFQMDVVQVFPQEMIQQQIAALNPGPTQQVPL